MLNLEKRRTKIVCTVGPASTSEDQLGQLIDAGMNVARLNFSHGSYDEHRDRLEKIRRLSRERNVPVAILQDLSGPKIRIGKMKSPVNLKKGDTFCLYREERTGDAEGVSTSYQNLVDVVEPGDTILLADGLLNLKVSEKHKDRVCCEVVVGGRLSSHKGINLPMRSFGIPSLTEKDRRDLAFGIELGVDFIALSFVREAADIAEVKALIREAGADIPVIAKIEKNEAIDNIAEIVHISDGIMVARGDLAVETALESVPVVQKKIIEKCNDAGKPVITATQMLKTMVDHPRPTRAEAADVANAVLDGTDAVMLSEETAVGNYPVLTVETMHRIMVRTEAEQEARWQLRSQAIDGKVSTPASVSRAATLLARDLKASAIITPTRSGSTARMIARYRPRMPIIALCMDRMARRRLCVVWGVYPYLAEKVHTSDELLSLAKDYAHDHGFVNAGERIVITAGWPIGSGGTTNLIKVEEL